MQPYSTPLSRRAMMRLGATGMLGVAAAACTDTSDSSEEPEDQPPAPPGRGDFKIPDAQTDFPSDDVKLSWMDPGDVRIPFFDDFIPAYTKMHPNLEWDYSPTNWNNITQVVTLGLRNGSAPDVFEMPTQITTPDAVSNDWIGAFDDIIPNFAEVKKRYPPWSFANGVTDFNGKTYIMPLNSAARFGTLLLFNRDLTEEAGYQLDKDIISWDQLREYAKELTDQGGGNYYGLIMSMAQPGAISGPAGVMAQMAGLANGIEGIDYRTGEYHHDDPIAVEIIETFLAMRDDGSIHPDSANLDAPGARGRMPQGQAAFMFQGPWNISIWQDENPDFNLGLNIPPQRDPNGIAPVVYGPGGTERWAYHAKTKVAPVIGDIFSYFSSDDGQLQWVYYSAPGLLAAFPEAMKRAKLDELSEQSLRINEEYMAIRPEPAARNPDVMKALLEQVPVQPTLSDVVDAIYTKQDDRSVAQALKEHKDKEEKSLDDAIAAAKKKGAKVSRDDWVFPDWDPRQPYTKLYTD